MTEVRDVGVPPDRQRDARRFNVLWFGQAVSQFGDYLPYISLPLFVKYLTDGTFAVALTYALEVTPAIIVGFVGGLLIDRLRLHRVMIVTDLLRAAAFGVLAWIAASDTSVESGTGLVAALSVAFVAGTLAAFFTGALFSAVPRLVSAAQLATANSRLAASQNLATILGPAAAGVLIASIGFWPTFAINAATFVVSATAVAFVGPMDGPRDAEEESSEELLAEATAGLRRILSDPRLKISTIAVAGANLVLGFIESTLVIALDEIGAVEEWQKGLMFAVFGTGALAGSVLAPAAIRKAGNGRILVLGCLVFGIMFAFFTGSRFGLLSGVLLFTSFIGFQFLAIAYTTIRQKYTPEHLLGRVATASRALAWSTLPIGAVAGSLLADFTDYGLMVRLAPVAVLVIGVGLIPTVIWKDTP